MHSLRYFLLKLHYSSISFLQKNIMKFKALIAFIITFFLLINMGYSQIEKSKIEFDSLKNILDSVYYYDQYFFNSGLKGKEKYTDEELILIKTIEKRQFENLTIVTSVLDTYGWLGIKEVGQKAADAIFLTIQHNDLEKQIKYLPLLQKAVEKGNANASDMAMLEDRMAVKRGLKQKYGSQLPPHPITGKSRVWPIDNPEKVDALRKKVDLPPMTEYVSWWKLNWDLKEHLEYTNELEENGLMGFYKPKN